MTTTSSLDRDSRFAEAYHGCVGIDNLSILPVTYSGDTKPTRFIVTHRLSAGPGMVQSEISLSREQVAWLRDRLTDVLNDTDPAYIAHMERAAAMGEPALPATDDEWKDRLVEGGVA